MSASDRTASSPLLRVLRRPRDEAQLTQLLAAIADDPAVARELASVLVAASTEEHDLLPLPSVLRCRAEQTLHAADGGRHGRVDLRFDDDEGHFTLLVELKLHSGYGHDQVDRYRRALAELPRGRRAGLIAVTRNVPGVGEPSRGTRGWLGSIRWSEILEDLHRLPVQQPLLGQWRELLNVIQEQGDFGVGDLTEQDVRAWAAYSRTQEKLKALITDLAPQAEARARTALATRPAWAGSEPEQIAKLATRGREHKTAFPTKETVSARILLPARDGRERLRIQFLGGHEVPYFTVEARRDGARDLLAAASPAGDKFRAAAAALNGFNFQTDHSSYYALVHGPDEWLTETYTDTIGERLLTILDRDINRLVDSGILDPDSGFSTDAGQPENDDAIIDD